MRNNVTVGVRWQHILTWVRTLPSTSPTVWPVTLTHWRLSVILIVKVEPHTQTTNPLLSLPLTPSMSLLPSTFPLHDHHCYVSAEFIDFLSPPIFLKRSVFSVHSSFIVKGDICTVSSDRCSLRGDRCTLGCDWCTARGDKCTMNSKRCTLSDDRCTLGGDRCTLSGDRLTLSSDRCNLRRQILPLNNQSTHSKWCTQNKDSRERYKVANIVHFDRCTQIFTS